MEMTTERQIRIVTEGSKNLAMAHQVPILAVADSDAEGLKGERVRFQDLWGGASVKCEPDVALILNRGADIDRVLFSVEKNQIGPTGRRFAQRLLRQFFAFEQVRSEESIS